MDTIKSVSAIDSEDIIETLPLEVLFSDFSVANKLIECLEFFLEREMDDTGHDYWSELSQVQHAHITLLQNKLDELQARCDELLIRDDRNV